MWLKLQKLLHAFGVAAGGIVHLPMEATAMACEVLDGFLPQLRWDQIGVRCRGGTLGKAESAHQALDAAQIVLSKWPKMCLGVA